MPKFSIIVPVYNAGPYLNRCFDSILNQTFKDFELIVVNDGSTDDSETIIKSYRSKFDIIKVINQANQGLSIARNNGVKEASGEYLLFLDSDDYWGERLLFEIDQVIKVNNETEIIRFQGRYFDDYENFKSFSCTNFKFLKGPAAFRKMLESNLIEPACFYAFKRDFWIDQNYSFIPDVYHEDFGLIPWVIYNSKNVTSIPYEGYFYYRHPKSITKNVDKNINRKRAFDLLKCYDILIAKAPANDKYALFRSYLANALLIKAIELKGSDFKEYVALIKKRPFINDLEAKTILQKIKKIIIKISIPLYLKIK